MPAITRHYAHTALGAIHYAECGEGPAVLCLHQTPRSWDEYREVLPRLGESRRAIAMDLPGMGASDPHPRGDSIPAYAESAVALADALGLESLALVGHHTGGVVAARVAAETGTRVGALVLSSTPLVDAAARRRRQDRPPIDHVEPSDDGRHLLALWNRRAAFYPPARPDLRRRFVLDALRARDAEAGHLAVSAHRMEDDLPRIRCPVLVVAQARDPYSYPETEALVGAMTGAMAGVRTVTLDDGWVPLEYAAEAFAGAVAAFLDG